MNFVKYSSSSSTTLMRVLENVSHGLRLAKELNLDYETSAGTAVLSAIIECKASLIDAASLQLICSLVPHPKPSFAATVLAAVGNLFLGLAATNAEYANALKKVSSESKREWIAAVILLSMEVDADWKEVWKVVENGAKRYKEKASDSNNNTPDTTDMDEDIGFAGKSGKAGWNEADEDDEDDSDWNEEDASSDELDDAGYYDSAYDAIQPLAFLKTSLSKLKETNPNLFQARINYLADDSKLALQSILEG